jgi:hypothetical protein
LRLRAGGAQVHRVRESPLLYLVHAVVLLVGSSACASPDVASEAATEAATEAAALAAIEWSQVHATDALTISIDTASAVAWFNGTYAVRVRTTHAAPRYHEGQPWDRELAMVQLRCDHPAMRTRSVRLSAGDAPPIVVQEEKLYDIDQQPWRVADAGSGEAQAVEAACALLRAKPLSEAARRGQTVWPDGQSR